MTLRDDQIPTREACDLNDPEERFVWPFLDLPGVVGGSLILPVPMLKEISQHLDDCGVQIACESCGHEKQPKVKWRPVLGSSPMLGNAGQWVSFDTPDDENKHVREVLDQARPEVIGALMNELAQRFPDDETMQDLKKRMDDGLHG